MERAATDLAAVVAEASNLERSIEFWQLLMAAELGSEKSRILLREFGSSHSNWKEAFSQHPFLTDAERKRVMSCSVSAAQLAVDKGAEILSETALPKRLKGLDDSPIALFIEGDKSALEKPAVSIVGTRNASTYGRGCARKFAESFCHSDVTVVSGGALGIDAAAHEAAIAAEGATVAVLASGIDKIYPSAHAGLFKRIKPRGLLLTSYAAGTQPSPYKFLQRNWLIAALSDAVVVIEAPESSGALNTARAAKSLGKQVFVVPANIESSSFRGSHRLIREGATLVDDPSQVLDALGIAVGKNLKEVDTSPIGQTILQALTTTPQPLENLAEATGIEPSELLSELTMLELDGLILRELGGYASMP